MVLLSDYQTCENVLTQQTHFHDRADTVIKMFSNILPTGQIALKTNEMWKHHRRIIAPAMTSKYLSLTTPRANESIGNLVELWRAKSDAAGGRAWAAGNDMESSTMDAMCGMAFGSSWGIIRAFTDQVIGNHEEVPTGKMGDALFVGRPPPLAESTLVAFEVGPAIEKNPKTHSPCRRQQPFSA